MAGLVAPTLPASAAGSGGDTEVSVGSPSGPFARNKQNEPAVAVNAAAPNIVAAGSNDEIDMEACNAGPDTDCPFTEGVGVSGIYFSFNGGDSWRQPTYRGFTARNCDGAPGDDDPLCEGEVGPIGTLPNYYENGLVSDGDAALAFGPRPDASGNFSWSNGSRLYYANLTSNFPGQQRFKGFEAIAVSRTDKVRAAARGQESAWKAPVIASKQNSALFADKEQIWADNASSSPHFGNAYVCYAAFQGVNGTSQPLKVLTSTDGGSSWTQKKVTPATNNINSQNGFGRSGCTIRTDSDGVVYVFAFQFGFGTPGVGYHILIKSFDGGKTWERPQRIFPVVDTCVAFEPSIGRCVQDGVGGARNDLGASPSVDIANGAPTGADATDEIIDTWVDGRDGINNEHVFYSTSGDGGSSWAATRRIESAGDRGYYSAPALAPDGTDAWIVYNAFTTPYRNNTTQRRGLVGVVKHAEVASNGSVGAFTQVHRGAVGDPRASSQNNLAAEFLGDYVYASASRDFAVAVWNDVRNGGVCPAINRYRQARHDDAVATGQQVAEAEEAEDDGLPSQEASATPPAVQAQCPFTFGNTDIFGGSYGDPTP
ncbi:hypothetical protein BH18ACT15_BH18ACT15_09060 [soil metagenome]